jgi:hypothetical protein
MQSQFIFIQFSPKGTTMQKKYYNVDYLKAYT